MPTIVHYDIWSSSKADLDLFKGVDDGLNLGSINLNREIALLLLLFDLGVSVAEGDSIAFLLELGSDVLADARASTNDERGQRHCW